MHLVTKVQRVLLISVSDPSLLTADTSCADWNAFGSSEPRASCCLCLGWGQGWGGFLEMIEDRAGPGKGPLGWQTGGSTLALHTGL